MKLSLSVRIAETAAKDRFAILGTIISCGFWVFGLVIVPLMGN